MPQHRVTKQQVRSAFISQEALQHTEEKNRGGSVITDRSSMEASKGDLCLAQATQQT